MNLKKLSPIGYWLLFAILIIIVMIILVVQDILKRNVEEIHEIKETPTYVLKIDYPITNNKKINKEIEDYIESKKKEFIVTADEASSTINAQYDFKINYEMYSIENVEFVHLILYSFTGGAHYNQEDKVWIYDKDTNKKVDITYFLEDDTFSKLQTITIDEIKKYYKEKDYVIDEEWIKEGTKSKENFSIFKIKEDNVEITFPPYEVGPWSMGNVVIQIPKDKLIGIIKPIYLQYEQIDQPSISIPQEKRDLSTLKDKKLLAFTFDDGPGGKTTTKLLDNLDQYNARVTFFVLGSRVNNFSNNLKRAYEMGNTIGSHTYNHFNLYKLDLEEQLKEITNTNDVIASVTGKKPIYLRPPYGNIKNEAKEQSGMYTILWDIDTEDWRKKNADKIADHIVKHAHDGGIVLLHDIYEYSVDGALKAMEMLKDEYAFVTIDEMIELKGKTLEPLKSYYSF